jgi:hypothetical protein
MTNRQALWDHLQEQHGLVLLQAELDEIERLASKWIAVRDQQPDKAEPVLYARPNPGTPGRWHVGIAYWTVSQRWMPQMAEHGSCGFTHWKPLGDMP